MSEAIFNPIPNLTTKELCELDEVAKKAKNAFDNTDSWSYDSMFFRVIIEQEHGFRDIFVCNLAEDEDDYREERWETQNIIGTFIAHANPDVVHYLIDEVIRLRDKLEGCE